MNVAVANGPGRGSSGSRLHALTARRAAGPGVCFRREWRQQLLVLALISVAVTATIVGSAVATNTPPPATAGFGTAQDAAAFAGNDPRLGAEIATLQAPLRQGRRHREQDAAGSRLGQYLPAACPEPERPLRPTDAVPRFRPLPDGNRPGRRHAWRRIGFQPQGRRHLESRRRISESCRHRREPTEPPRRVRPRSSWTGEVSECGHRALRRSGGESELDRRTVRLVRSLGSRGSNVNTLASAAQYNPINPETLFSRRADYRHAAHRTGCDRRLHGARPATAALARHAGLSWCHTEKRLPGRARPTAWSSVPSGQ